MPQPSNYILEGGASNQVQRIICQKFILKSDINFIRILLSNWILTNQQNFSISKRPFETLEAMRILNIGTYVMLFQSSDTFRKEFVPS
jgi:hypothetical protein